MEKFYMMFYVFISHNVKIVEHYEIISKNMSELDYNNYGVFYGGTDKHLSKEHIIHIDCDDTYEGLPNKIYSICKYLSSNNKYKNFSHFCKIDGTTPVISLVPIFSNINYYGSIIPQNNARNWHFEKTSIGSIWKNKSYTGKYIPYCSGGCYVLSRKAIECIAKYPDNPEKDIFEDLYVAQQLIKDNIYPTYYNVKQHLPNNSW